MIKPVWSDPNDPDYKQRQQNIRTAWNYYEGRHPQPLRVRNGQVSDNTTINIARLIVDKGIAFLFGKPVTWQVDESSAAPDLAVEQHLKDVWAANNQAALLHELAQNGALAGMAFVKVVVQAGGFPRLINLDPAAVQLAWTPGDVDDVCGYRIQYRAADADGDQHWYRQDIVRQDGPGSTWTIADFEAESSAGQTTIAWKLVAEPVVWPYVLPPIVHCKNLPRANCAWGYSDLEDISLNDAVNLNVSSTRKILRLHAHPRTFGTGFRAGDLESWGPEDMWTVQNKDAKVGNVEMQSDLTAARAFYEDLRAALYSSARIPDLSTLGQRLGQITNFGLHVLFADLLEKNGTKRVQYGGLIVGINRLLALLGGYGDAVTTKLTWPDPLPEDRLQKAQEILTLQQTGLVSDETLTAELGYTYKDEQQRLADERERKQTTADQLGSQLLSAFDRGGTAPAGAGTVPAQSSETATP